VGEGVTRSRHHRSRLRRQSRRRRRPCRRPGHLGSPV